MIQSILSKVNLEKGFSLWAWIFNTWLYISQKAIWLSLEIFIVRVQLDNIYLAVCIAFLSYIVPGNQKGDPRQIIMTSEIILS